MKHKGNICTNLSDKFYVLPVYPDWVLLTTYKFISQITPLSELHEGRHKVYTDSPCAPNELKNESTIMQVSTQMLPCFGKALLLPMV